MNRFTNNDSMKLCHGLHSWSLSSWRPRFDPRPVHLGFVVDNVVLGLIFVPAHAFFCAVIPPIVCTHFCIIQSMQFLKLTRCQHASIEYALYKRCDMHCNQQIISLCAVFYILYCLIRITDGVSRS